QKATKRAEIAEKLIVEQQDKLHIAQIEAKLTKEEYEQEKEISEQEEQKAIEEETKRMDEFIEKEKVELESQHLKREMERLQKEVREITEKFGEEQIIKLKHELELVRSEKEKEIKMKEQERRRADEAGDRVRIAQEEKDKEIKKRENAFQQKLKEKQELQKQINEGSSDNNEYEQLEDQKLDQEIQRIKTENKRLIEEKQKQRFDRQQYYMTHGGIQIDIFNPDPQELSFSDVDGVMKMISKKKDMYNTISLTEVLRNGIFAMEVQLQNSQSDESAVGIVRNSYDIPAGTKPWLKPHHEHIAIYSGSSWGRGCVYYKGKYTYGNIGFKENQIVRTEFDSEKGTLTFFLEGVQQPVFISGINEEVRFIVHMFQSGSNCIIRSLKKIPAPTAVRLPDEKEIKW
ncbi:MAG: hypothetical protein EZS28_033992, partial [Streblomastix strix]